MAILLQNSHAMIRSMTVVDKSGIGTGQANIVQDIFLLVFLHLFCQNEHVYLVSYDLKIAEMNLIAMSMFFFNTTYWLFRDIV